MTKYNLKGVSTGFADSCGGSRNIQYYDWVFYNDSDTDTVQIALDPNYLDFLTSNEPGQDDCPESRASLYLYEGSLVPASVISDSQKNLPTYSSHQVYEGGWIELAPNSSAVFQTNYYNPQSNKEPMAASNAAMMQVLNLSTGAWTGVNTISSPIGTDNQIMNVQAGLYGTVSNSNAISYALNSPANSQFSSDIQYFVVDAGGADINTEHISLALTSSIGTSSVGMEDSSSTQLKGLDSPRTSLSLQNADRIKGTASSEILNGYQGNDFLNGIGGDDLLLGDKGHDILVGGHGRDFLDGGRGADHLTGSQGADYFVLVQCLGGRADTITDFARKSDKLVFSTSSLGLDQKSDPYTVLRLESSRTSQAKGIGPTLVYNSNTNALFYDRDGIETSSESSIIAYMNSAPKLSSILLY